MKTTKIKVLMLSAVLTLAVAFGGVATAQAQAPITNIGVFDLQKSLSDSKKGKAARNGLENRLKKMQTDLTAKEREVTKLSDDLKKQVEAKAAQDVLRRKDEEFRQKYASYQEQMVKYNEEMRKAEETALKPLIDKAVKAAGDIGRQRGYILVLEVQQAGVVYALDAIDITSEVIKEIDR
ncbi:MAG: OmpH family outer membrane protein [Candidatus Adiutrix sp.]